MTFRHGLLALLLSANIAAAQPSLHAPSSDVPPELMRPEPLELTPDLRAPGGTEGLTTEPETPAAPLLSPSRAEQPGDPEQGMAEPTERVRVVPEPLPRSEPRRRAESRRSATAARTTGRRPAAARATPRSTRSATARPSRPLAILPPAVRSNTSRAEPQTQTVARAFAPPPALPVLPWPFRLAPTQSRFDTPGGWW